MKLCIFLVLFTIVAGLVDAWFTNPDGASSSKAMRSQETGSSKHSETRKVGGKKRKRIMRSEKVARETREREAAKEFVEMDSEGEATSHSKAHLVKQAVALGITSEELDKMLLDNQALEEYVKQAQFRASVEGSKISELRLRLEALGVDQREIDAADDSSDRKAAFVALVKKHEGVAKGDSDKAAGSNTANLVSLAEFLQRTEESDADPIFLEQREALRKIRTARGSCPFGDPKFECEDGHKCDYSSVASGKRWTVEREGDLMKTTTDGDISWFQKLPSNDADPVYYFDMYECHNQPLIVRAFLDMGQTAQVSVGSCSADHLDETVELEGMTVKESFDFQVLGNPEQEQISKHCLGWDATSGESHEHDLVCRTRSEADGPHSAHTYHQLSAHSEVVTVSMEVLGHAVEGRFGPLLEALQAQGKQGLCPEILLQQSGDEEDVDEEGSAESAALDEISQAAFHSTMSLDEHLDKTITRKCWSGAALGLMVAGGLCGVATAGGCAAVAGPVLVSTAAQTAGKCAAQAAASPARRRRRWR